MLFDISPAALLGQCWVVDGKQPSGKTKDLYDSQSAVHKLLDEAGLSLPDAANKCEWHNKTRPEALAARAASRFPAQVAAQRPSDVTKGAAPATSRAHANLSPGET
jgi:hypothetical protein